MAGAAFLADISHLTFARLHCRAFRPRSVTPTLAAAWIALTDNVEQHGAALSLLQRPLPLARPKGDAVNRSGPTDMVELSIAGYRRALEEVSHDQLATVDDAE